MTFACRVVAVFCLTLGAVVISTPAAAQSEEMSGEPISIGEYEDILYAKDGTMAENALKMNWYLRGLHSGLGMAGGVFAGNGAAPLLCVPDGKLERVREYADMIGRELDERPGLWRKDIRAPVARVAVEAMRRRFPCR